MKKALLGIVVVIIVIAGGYAIFHKSSPAATTGSATKAQTPAVNDAIVITKNDSTLGQYLADPSGRALYTYAADSSGVSNCTGSCLATWPAYQAKGSTTNLPSGIGTITRTDNGQLQYTYMGKPLYYFASDSNGQVTGNNVENFQIAKPSAASAAPATAAPSTSPSSNSSSGYPY